MPVYVNIKTQDAKPEKFSFLKRKVTKNIHPSLTDNIPSKTWYHIAFKTRRATAIISVIDVMLALLERRWFALKNFHEHKVPWWGSGLFNMVPSLAIWAVLLRDWINRKPDDATPDLGATKSFLKQFSKLKHTHDTLEQHPDEKHQFHGMLHAFNYPGSNIYIDCLLGNIVLGLRFLNGVIFMLQTLQYASPENSKNITDVSSDVFTLVNALYTAYMILRGTMEKPTTNADDFFYSTATVNKAIRKFKEYGKRCHQKDLVVAKAAEKFKRMGHRHRMRKLEDTQLHNAEVTPLQKFSVFHAPLGSLLQEPLLPQARLNLS